MSYLDKISKSVIRFKCPHQKSVTIPHQAFTPREILQQFVVNDVQVMQRQPTDDLGDFDGDVNRASSSVMDFEDDFQARNFVRNEMPDYIKSKRSKEESGSSQDPPKEETGSSQDPLKEETGSSQDPPKDQ